jgi:hypothetical protein
LQNQSLQPPFGRVEQTVWKHWAAVVASAAGIVVVRLAHCVQPSQNQLAQPPMAIVEQITG